MRSRFQLQIDQVILCLKSSVNQQRLLADKKLEGTCSGVYFKRFKSFMPIHIGRLFYIMLAFFEHFSEAKALSIIRAF